MRREKTWLGSQVMHCGRMTRASRWSVSRLKATSGVARELAVVVQELGEFLDPDVIPDWLLTEQYTLGGRTPIQALRDGDVSEVLRAANETEHGAYI
jgi:hypothetical protein